MLNEIQRTKVSTSAKKRDEGMMKGIAWLVSACLVVVAMLAGCAPASPTPTATPTITPEVKPTATPTPGPEMVRDSLGNLKEKPKYGGIGRYQWQGVGTLGSWDPVAPIAGRTWHLAMYENMVQADITKGPQGTNEFAFGVVYYVPNVVTTGMLAESWEIIDLQNIIYHLRHGVYYQNKPPANGREMVADDAVFSWVRHQADPKGYWYKPPGTAPEKMIQATAIDKYTLKVHWPYPDARILQDSNGGAYPPEAVKQYGNLDDWHNACGTGAWIVADYIPDSSITYKKNPNYWGTDPFFPQNKTPYMDGWVDINIPDYQTGLAAIRTGQVDWGSGITWEDAESLKKTNPELLSRGTLNFYNPVIEVRNDVAPFSDIRVRKALAIAIDRKGIVRDFYKGNGEVLTWPYYPELKNIYVPLDQLPADCQELFNYNPTKAKQLLTDAGYPTGFKNELMVPSYAPFPDLANIIKSYWDAVGVTTTVKVMEGGAFYGQMYGNNYPQSGLVHWSNGDPLSIYSSAYYKGRLYNYSKTDDPYVIEVYNKLIATPDGPEQDKIYKEAGPKVLAQCYNICMPGFYQYTFWEPWVKAYSGEMWGAFNTRWIDLSLRQKMIGK